MRNWRTCKRRWGCNIATKYVNSLTGNDANDGSTWALAKKTLAAVNTAASAGDTIYAHGIFTEALPVAKSLNWIGVGYAAVDGTNSISGSNITGVSINLINLILKNFLTTVFDISAPTVMIYCHSCIFDGNARAFRDLNNSATGAVNINLINTQVINHSVAGFDWAKLGAAPDQVQIDNCVFAGNAIGIRRQNATGNVAFRVRNSLLADVIMVQLDAAGGWDSPSDYNAFDFTNGKCIVGGVDKTTLATWKTAVGAPRDVNSVDRVLANDIGDKTNGALRSNPAGALLTLGAGGLPIGLTLPALTVSNNKNASLWTNGLFTNCELDGSGYLVLSAGQTVGTFQTDVIDFGASIAAKSVEIALANEAAALPYLDYDTGDSPNYLNIRVRGSNSAFLKGDASPSWVIVPRRAEISAYMSNALRYWQIELTLRA